MLQLGNIRRSPESFCSIRPRFRQWSSGLRLDCLVLFSGVSQLVYIMDGGGENPVDEIPLARVRGRGRGRGRGRPRVHVVDDTFVEQASDHLDQLRMDELVARFHSMHPP
ncbi:uncharacterized protein LOC142523624 isoform X2 [Primulina tabacum]|uniref:uncharacterized protein LOC142523624 isoform X2 n=1 Tax=Primulina tabacum TaxID=48773 RepID=UPI003F59B441